MSLTLTSFHPCRVYWFARVFWSCSVFFFFFFHSCSQFLLSDRTNLLHREQSIVAEEGWRLGGNISSPFPLSSPAQANVCAAWGRWLQRLFMCVYVWVCACVYACEEDRANQSSSRYLPPYPVFVWSAPSPPLSGFCCSISHSLRCSLWHTHARTHTHSHQGRRTRTHMHTSANPLTTHQCPEQIKGLHISNCIPNVPPLHGSPSSSSCTFYSSSCATTGLCTCFWCFFFLRSVFNLWQLARLPLQLRWPGSQPEAVEETHTGRGRERREAEG